MIIIDVKDPDQVDEFILMHITFERWLRIGIDLDYFDRSEVIKYVHDLSQ